MRALHQPRPDTFRPPAAQRVEAQARQARGSRQPRSAGHLIPHRPCPVQARPAATAASIPASTSYLRRIIGASPLCRSPGLCRPPGSQPPRHRALATGPRRAARRSGDRPARPPKTHPQPCPPSRWPPQAHRRPGYGTRTSRPRRPSSEVGHRQADAGHSSLRPRQVTVYHSRSVPIRMQAKQRGRVNASANGRGGAPRPLPHRCRTGAFACKKRATARRCRTTGCRAVPSARRRYRSAARRLHSCR